MNTRFLQEIHNMQIVKFIWDLCSLVSPQEGAVRMERRIKEGMRMLH